MIFSFAVILFVFAGTVYASPVHNTNEALGYFQKFDFLEKLQPGILTVYKSVSSAVLDIQKVAGLPETGKLNGNTINMMNIPRCGLIDKENRNVLEESNRPLTGLAYNIKKYPVNVKDVAEVGQEIAKAFKIWRDVTESCFKDEGLGRLDINFNFDTTENGDEKGSAHTFFPRYDNADTTENQSTDEKINLPHMKKQFDLTVAQAMEYKSNEEEEVKEPIHALDICEDASLDTITRIKDGNTYAFKGDYCWKINYNVTADGYPKKIADDFDGLEGNLDASFTAPDGKTYFFKGRRCWRFTNKKMDSGYPKLISEEFRGIPDNLDAALTWGRNGKPYFFKGDQYWRYDADEYPQVKDQYPLSIKGWKGLPIDGIDASVLWENNASYFFNRGNYYRFDDRTSEVSKQYNYPASIAIEWFSCVHRR